MPSAFSIRYGIAISRLPGAFSTTVAPRGSTTARSRDHASSIAPLTGPTILIVADFGLHREGPQPLLHRVGAAAEKGDVAEQPGRGCDEKRRREAIACLLRIIRQRSQQRRIDDEGARRDLEHPLDAAAPGTLLDQLEEPFALELAQVIVERLPSSYRPCAAVDFVAGFIDAYIFATASFSALSFLIQRNTATMSLSQSM